MIKQCKKCQEEFTPAKDGNYCQKCRLAWDIAELKHQLEFKEFQLKKLTEGLD